MGMKRKMDDREQSQKTMQAAQFVGGDVNGIWESYVNSDDIEVKDEPLDAENLENNIDSSQDVCIGENNDAENPLYMYNDYANFQCETSNYSQMLKDLQAKLLSELSKSSENHEETSQILKAIECKLQSPGMQPLLMPTTGRFVVIGVPITPSDTTKSDIHLVKKFQSESGMMPNINHLPMLQHLPPLPQAANVVKDASHAAQSTHGDYRSARTQNHRTDVNLEGNTKAVVKNEHSSQSEAGLEETVAADDKYETDEPYRCKSQLFTQPHTTDKASEVLGELKTLLQERDVTASSTTDHGHPQMVSQEEIEPILVYKGTAFLEKHLEDFLDFIQQNHTTCTKDRIEVYDPHTFMKIGYYKVILSTKHRRRNRDEGRRSVHNSLERERRVDLCNAFEYLRQLVPATKILEKASKVQILKKAALHCKKLHFTELRLLKEKEKLKNQLEELQQRRLQSTERPRLTSLIRSSTALMIMNQKSATSCQPAKNRRPAKNRKPCKPIKVENKDREEVISHTRSGRLTKRPQHMRDSKYLYPAISSIVYSDHGGPQHTGPKDEPQLGVSSNNDHQHPGSDVEL